MKLDENPDEDAPVTRLEMSAAPAGAVPVADCAVGTATAATHQQAAEPGPALGQERAARYWPSFAVKDLVTALGVTVVVVLLAVFLVPRQIVTDPIYRTALPSPDWLYLFYLLPYMYLRGLWQLPVLLTIPPLAVFLLLLVPFVQRNNPATPSRGLRRNILVVSLCVFVLGTALSATAYTGARVPAQGCEACHRPRMVGTPPTEVEAFGHRDSQWLAKHLVDPQYWWLR